MPHVSDQDRTGPPGVASGQPEQVVGGEVELPLEHTERVRVARGQAPPPVNLRVHDEAPPPAPRSSTELAQRSNRERRRQRDRRAERRAVMLVFALFVGVGGAALFAVNVLWPEEPVEVATPASTAAQPPPPVPVAPTPTRTVGGDQPVDLPVLRILDREGLTIGAEGLPEVLALVDQADVSRRAALESCRFAFAVWELSPNKRFRFLSTCGPLKGQILVGAYVVDGTKIRMSPLGSTGVKITTELELERPTKATTSITEAGAPTPMLAVRQRLTAIRPGLEGEAFRDAFAPRNTIAPRQEAVAPPPPAPAPPPRTPRDPVLDLLEGN